MDLQFASVPKPSPDTTQPIEDSQILSAGAPGQPPAIPRDPDVSGWMGLPLRSEEFAPARPAARRGRRWWWLLLALVIAGSVAAGLGIFRPRTTTAPR